MLATPREDCGESDHLLLLGLCLKHFEISVHIFLDTDDCRLLKPILTYFLIRVPMRVGRAHAGDLGRVRRCGGGPNAHR